ncbi:MAG: hypothetical protein L0H83_00385 [Salinisphaera sp.]|nr:hypothetical protein [Salinisphaera sp.]
MAKANYPFEKRQREIAKKKKKEEKRAKKQSARETANPDPVQDRDDRGPADSGV